MSEKPHPKPQPYEDTSESTKRPYAPPQLKEYGSVAELTRGSLGFFPDTTNGSRKTPTF